MNLNLISPFNKKTKNIAWVEVDTTCGNFIIEQEHAPMISALEKDSFIVNQLFITIEPLNRFASVFLRPAK